MKKRINIIMWSVTLFTSGFSEATITIAQGPMRYFLPFKGTWEIKDALKMETMDNLTETTSCGFSDPYDIFTVSRGYHNGQMSFGERVTIMNVANRSCHAVLYKEQSPSYFHGTPDKASKVLVLETLNPKFKGHKYLIIDFRPCPKKPPTFYTSDKKPKG